MTDHSPRDREHLSDTPQAPVDLNTLDAQLDAWGRTLVSDEERRAVPPAEYLQMVTRRALFIGATRWSMRAALAAACLGIGLTIVYLTAGVPHPGAGPQPKASVAAASAEAASPGNPSVARLNTINRGSGGGDLQLSSGSTAEIQPQSGSTEPTTRAADSRRSDRVDSLLAQP